MNFKKLTDKHGKSFYVDLSHVTVMRRGEETTVINLANGEWHYAKETPEEILA